MKRFFCLIFFIGIFSFIQAQEDVIEEDSVFLPDLTTVISGEKSNVSDSAIPDFSSALPSNLDENLTLPDLHSVNISNSDDANFLNTQENEENRSVFMEGEIAFGLPVVFLGDFSVYSIDSSPFSVRFKHDSVTGYSFNSFEDGYFTNDTILSATKTINGKKILWFLGGTYEAWNIGLQSKSPLLANINRRNIVINSSFSVPIGEKFSFSLDLNGDVFSRYAGFSGLQGYAAENEKTSLSFAKINPIIDFSFALDNFTIGLDGMWYSGLFFKSEDASIHRGNIGLFATWLSDFISVRGKTSAVFVPFGTGSEKIKVIPPFYIGVNLFLPVAFSSMPLSIDLEGGLSSCMFNIENLEKENPFTSFTPDVFVQNVEQSDWYGSVLVSIPIKSVFSIDLNAIYRKTAFGNGLISSFYEEIGNENTGLFYSKVVDRQELLSQVGVSGVFNDFSASLNWTANWLYVPYINASQNISVVFSYLSNNGKFALDFEFMENLGKNVFDFTPIINLNTSFRIGDAMKIALNLKDCVKLFTGKDRVFVEPYVLPSGIVTASIQFFY